MDISTRGATRSYANPLSYYVWGDVESGDAARELYDRFVANYPGNAFAVVYRHLVTGEIARARELVLPLFIEREDYSAVYENALIARLAVDALIDSGDANLAIDMVIVERRVAPVSGEALHRQGAFARLAGAGHDHRRHHAQPFSERGFDKRGEGFSWRG